MNKNGLFGMLVLLVLLTGCNKTTLNTNTTEVTKVTTVSIEEKTVVVNTSQELHQALKNAKPGHRIILKSGETFIGNKGMSGESRAYFYAFVDGTKDYPITILGEDENHPPILSGTTVDSGYGLYVTGDYYVIQNIKVENAQKGIMLDHSNYSLITNCEVYNIGHEGIHLRDGSSFNTIEKSFVHDTGKLYEGYGEGIYVGSDKGKWSTLAKDANDNVIKDNILGPNVAAEHIDIKEGTLRTIIENNTFNGVGISGVHYADSFIDAKGNNAVIRNNTFNQNENRIIVDAIQVSTQIAGWGFQNEVYDNIFNVDADVYLINVFTGSAKAKHNTRLPEGHLYKGNVSNLE